ncbi:tape measure protein [Streptococcus pluranimalium]|uniref:Tape measure protein N-terminal domain-containing protein n=1 Tax=Streptococcus pluranimalium TaxID=82348 RepID=A0A345VIK5_9STRE|nr:tape measure protein [Streptococcus pluranimalium]AXJ12557.1 hypothetical protein Sp14A_06280 [Streptococcus pluranimalium]
MADSKTYTVEAILKASDSNFSKVMKGAMSAVGALGNGSKKTNGMFKSMFGANLASSALIAGLGAAKRGIGSMVTELNSSNLAWKSFEGNMKILGKSDKAIAKAKASMQDYATKTIYSASDMASTYAQLASVGVKNTGKLVKGFGGLAAAAENPKQAMKTLSQQATQMAAKPMVQWADFKLMLEQTPSGIAAVAKEMGMSTQEMVKAVQDGKISTEDFFEAIQKVGNSKTFSQMATEFKSIGQAIDGMKEGISNKLQPAFEKFNQFGIKVFKDLASRMDKINFDGIAEKIGAILSKIDVSATFDKIGTAISIVVGYIKQFIAGFQQSGALDQAKQSFEAIGKAISKVSSSIGNTDGFVTLGNVVGNLVNSFMQVAEAAGNFIAALPPGVINAIVSAVMALGAGFLVVKTGVSIAQKLATAWGTVKAAFNFGSALVKLVAQMLGLAGAQAAAAASSAGVAAGNTAVGTTSAASAGSVMRLGAAVLMVGAGVVLAAAGVWVLVQAAIQLGSAGMSAWIAMAALVAVVAGLATLFSVLGPALTAGAVGMLAFGAAFALVSAGIALVIASLSLLAPYIPQISQAFNSGAIAVAMAISMIVSSVASGIATVIGAIAGGVATIVASLAGLVVAFTGLVNSISGVLSSLSNVFTSIFDGIANVITAFGTSVSSILESVGSVFKSFGEAVKSVFEGAGQVIESFGNAVNTILDGVSKVLDSIGTAALNAGKGFNQLANGIVKITNTNLKDMAASLAAAAIGLGKIADKAPGLSSAGTAMSSVSKGIRTIGTASTTAVSGMSQLVTRIQMLQTTMTSLPGVMMSVASSFSSFTTTAVAGMAGLVAINAQIAAFKLQLTSLSTAVTQASMNFTRLSTGVMVIIPTFTMMTSIITMFITNLTMLSTTIMTISASFTALVGVITSMTGAIMMVASSFSNVGAQATNAGNQIRLFASTSQLVISGFSSMAGAVRSNMSAISSAISSGMSRAKSEVQSSMNVMLSTMQKTGNQMVSSMKSSGSKAGQGLSSGLKSQQGSVTNAVASMINAAVNRARAGYGSMQSAGNWIGQGLANGMRSALGAVTAAANALVAQAERAAQAKARIASPSKLFRDEVGYWIGAGVAVGIDKSANLAVNSIASMYDDIQSISYKANDLLDTNFGYNITSSHSGTLQVENPSQNNLILGLLDQLNRSLDRDIVVSVNDSEIARATGDAIHNYNLKKETTMRRMRGDV